MGARLVAVTGRVRVHRWPPHQRPPTAAAVVGCDVEAVFRAGCVGLLPGEGACGPGPRSKQCPLSLRVSGGDCGGRIMLSNSRLLRVMCISLVLGSGMALSGDNLRKRALRRVAAALVGLGVTVGIGTLSAPVAVADSVSRPIAAGSTPTGIGSVDIQTEPDGYINVSITGRTNGIRQDGARFCRVHVDNKQHTNVRLDDGGNGTARFGPFPHGEYQVGGTCTDWAQGEIRLLSSGGRVVIDGNGPAGELGVWMPPPPVKGPGPKALTLSEQCDAWAFDLGLASTAATAIAGPGILPVVLSATAGLRAGCLAVAAQVGEGAAAAQQFCDGVQDVILGLIPGVEAGIGTLFLPSVCSFAD